MTSRVALVTCATLPDLDPDDRLAAQELRTMGVHVVPVVWDDPAVDWNAFDLAVVRSTWDYPARRPEFVEWARRVPRLANPADVIAWNTDKRYLLDLASAGVDVVPTTWLTPADPVVLPARGRHVLKPSVGAGSLDAASFALNDERELSSAREHVGRLLAAGRDVMIQPYLEQIETRGETAVMFVGGAFSHAVSKAPMLVGERSAQAGGLFLEETITAHEPTQAELDIASETLAAVPGGADRLLYARVDLVPNGSGEPVVLELELTEPSLFMRFDPGAPKRFAEAIAARLPADK